MQNDSNSNNSITLEHVSKIYPGKKGPALSDASFKADAGEFVCIIGASGCGKSTLLRIIAGLEAATEGSVRAPEKTAMVFQNGALFPWLTVEQNVAVVLEEESLSDEQKKELVREKLSMLKILPFAKNYPRELSGGQRQRVGFARALATAPQALLLDEPFSALDEEITHELHEDLHRIWKETNMTIVMVSHSITEAVALAQRIVFMKGGKIEDTFSIEMPEPRHEQGARFMEEVQKIRAVFFKKSY